MMASSRDSQSAVFVRLVYCLELNAIVSSTIESFTNSSYCGCISKLVLGGILVPGGDCLGFAFADSSCITPSSISLDFLREGCVSFIRAVLVIEAEPLAT